MDVPESPTTRARSPSYRLFGGWMSDSQYLGEISLLCNEVGYIYCLFMDHLIFIPFDVLCIDTTVDLSDEMSYLSFKLKVFNSTR